MFLRILTLTLCLTNAFVYGDFKETTIAANFSIEPLYNVHEWVTKLHLQRCAFVGIGLKLFAIFVEDEILGKGKKEHRKYFLGVCQQTTLEKWNLCSPELAKKKKHKCRLKLSPYKFGSRVHRRFCDLRIMVNNRDCICEPTIFGDDMFKVKGFPTCYIPPLPSSLCRYNVCGLSKCKATTVEDRLHTVDCDSKCKGGNPFCEYPIDRTSRVPAVRSSWSKWREGKHSESPKMTGRKHSIATCINKYTGKGDVDCLGPGTGCCPRDIKNCTCNTYEENGTLRLERMIYEQHKAVYSKHKHSNRSSLIHRSFSPRRRLVCIKDNEDYDIDDDDEETGDLDEDIVLEEHVDKIADDVSTTEEPEKEEAVQELKKEYSDEVKKAKSPARMIKSTNSYSTYSIVLIILRSFYQDML